MKKAGRSMASHLGSAAAVKSHNTNDKNWLKRWAVCIVAMIVAVATICGGLFVATPSAEAATTTTSFRDVHLSTPHASDIKWLARTGISTGWQERDGSTTFRGMNAVVRQDMAAFLYRLVGSPSFDETKVQNPFSDVTPETPHYREILWLASTGISTGWQETDGTTTFRGMSPVVRQDMAAFLHRLADQQKADPKLGTALNFRDVNETTPHHDDITWLSRTGVTEGWVESNGTRTFRGMNAVVRQDMAAFLHRMSVKVLGVPDLPVEEETTVEPLHVEGARLVNAQGETKQLRGVSTHGIAWFPQYVNGDLFGWLKQDWGINTVRLSMYTAEYGGYCTGGNQSQLKSLVRKGINAAIDNDMYVIVDWHSLSDGNPNTYVSEAKQFFNTISKEYAGKANIIYEICNEPNGGTTWSDVKRYAQQVIPVIRANDRNAVILVGNPNWDQDLQDVQRDPLKYDNVMYTLHFYANTHGADLRNTLVNAVKAGTPVFVSEFGTTDASGNGAVNESSSKEWLTTLDKYHVSYMIWSLSNKGESTSLFVTNNYTHPTTSDLSEQGRWYRSYLRSH